MQEDDGFFVLILGVLAAVLTIVTWWHLGDARSTAVPPLPSPTATPLPTPQSTPASTTTAAPTATPAPTPTVEPTPTTEPTLTAPIPAELEAELNAIVTAEPIEFTVGSARLTGTSTATLDRIAALLADTTADIVVVGHTDDRGDPLQNDELSLERARSVANYLVANGIDELRINAEGRGGTEPLADNDTDEGRARNRRIEFEVRSAED